MSSLLVALGSVLGLALAGFAFVWRTAKPLPRTPDKPTEPQVVKLEVSITTPNTQSVPQYAGSGVFTLRH